MSYDNFARVGELFEATPEDRARQGPNGVAQTPESEEIQNDREISDVPGKSSEIDLLGKSQFGE